MPRNTLKLDAKVQGLLSDELLTRAAVYAGKYRIVLEPSAKGGFIGWALELPGALGEGETADRCVAETREMITVAVASLLENDIVPPAVPSTSVARDVQINIRVSQEEKQLLENAARDRSIRSVSEFVRHAAVQSAKSGSPRSK